MNWEERLNSLEKVKYAEMTELKKISRPERGLHGYLL